MTRYEQILESTAGYPRTEKGGYFASDTIYLKCSSVPSSEFLNAIEAEKERLLKLSKRNPDLYIKNEIYVDWGTFFYCLKEAKHHLTKPNGCFYLIYNLKKNCELRVVSPVLRFELLLEEYQAVSPAPRV